MILKIPTVTIPMFRRGMRGVLALALVVSGMAIARDGNLAGAFGAGGIQQVAFDIGGGKSDQGYAMAIQADGRILLGGRAENGSGFDFAIARLTTSGQPDTTFGVNGRVVIDFALGGSDDSARSILVQADGRIVVVGRASYEAGGSDRIVFGIARLTSSGAPDLSFDLDGRTIVDFDAGGTLSADPFGAVVQADGKIVIAGALLSASGGDIALARLNMDGSPDSTLNATGRKVIPLPTAAIPQAIALRPSGEYVLAGAIFDVSATNPDMLVVQVQNNGDLDSGFGSGGFRQIAFDQGGDNWDVGRALAIDSQGRVVVVGDAAVSSTGTARTRFAALRLDASGTLDAGFGSGGRLLVPFQRAGIDLGGRAFGITLDNLERIVLAGEAGRSDLGNDDDVAIARLQANGILDENFAQAGRRLVAAGPGDLTDEARSVAIDPAGRIIAVGLTSLSGGLDFNMLAVAVIGDTQFADGFD